MGTTEIKTPADPAVVDPVPPAVDPVPPAVVDPVPPADPAGAGASITEEGIRKICEEIIGAFLDRFTNDKKEDEPPPPPKEDDSFDY